MRIVANLLCEAEWARAAAAERGVTIPPPPERLVRVTSVLGTLLACLAEPGDTLWTPVAAQPAIQPAGAIAWPEHGPLARLAPAPALAWGVTDDVARSMPPSCALRPAVIPDAWHLALRHARAPSATLHRRLCDRRRQMALARDLGLALPGARIVRSIEDVVAASDGLPVGSGRWVVKAPWSAAGRTRLRGKAGRLADDVVGRLRRLLAHHGELVFEPWLDRTADFGAVAVVVAGSVRLVGFHRQETSGGGAFSAVRPLGGEPAPFGLSDAEAAALHGAVHAVGRDLLGAGYEGAFGLDAWRWRDADGAEHFHAVGEINVRLTFGAIARRLAEQAGWDDRSGEVAPALSSTGAAPRTGE